MRPTDTDILHDNLRGVVPSYYHFFIFHQRNNIFIELAFVVFHLDVFEFGVGGFEGGEVQEGVVSALVFEFVGQVVFA